MYLVVPQLQNRQIKTERATEISTLEKVSESRATNMDM